MVGYGRERKGGECFAEGKVELGHRPDSILPYLRGMLEHKCYLTLDQNS